MTGQSTQTGPIPAKNGLCFILSPIGDEGSETRLRADKVHKYVIVPACESMGFEAKRADHIQQSGMITIQVVQSIIDAPLVIADLTDHNANVFYELAIRHATRKPFIQLIAKGNKIPFDVAGLRTIEIDLADIASVEKAKGAIKDQIGSFGDMTSPMDTPVSIAVDVNTLKASSNPLQKSVADLVLSMADVEKKISEVASGQSASEFAVRLAAEEVRAIANTVFARLNGLPDPALLTLIVDARGLLRKAKVARGRREATGLMAQLDESLGRAAMRLMRDEAITPERRRRKKQKN